jgi:hypothetical protein
MEGTKRFGGEDIILSIDLFEVRGQGYSWRIRTADGEIVRESPPLPTLQECLADACKSPVLSGAR